MRDLSDSTHTADTVAEGKAARERPVETLPAGTKVGRYVVVEAIGRGGMGVVYGAHDPVLDRDVALKLFRPSVKDASSIMRARERLLREAQALARLSHPNIVVVHDLGEHDGGLFLAMELVRGTTLRHWMAGRPRSTAEILRVLCEAGAGLAAAHHINIVHRDFKPDNVIVGADGRARVLDFGLARSLAAGDSSDEGRAAPAAIEAAVSDPAETPAPATETDAPTTETNAPVAVGSAASAASRLATPLTLEGTVLGTPRYMSPEQRRGLEADQLADQFSFCVTAYECLFGELPDNGDEDAGRAARARVAAQAASRRGIAGRWRKAILRGLERDKRLRFPSMDALLRELRWDPVAARRRIRLGVAAALLLGLAGAAWLRAPASRAAECRAASARHAGEHWNDALRSRVVHALAGSGAPHAAELGQALVRRFDEYVAAWTAARSDACEDTRVRGERSEPVLDLRMRCFDTRLAELSALASFYAGDVDRAAATRALEAASALPRLSRCDDVAALSAAVPPPEDPTARARVDDVDAQLRHVKTLTEVGRHHEALQEARHLVEPARQTGYGPLEARLAFTLGRLESINGDPKAGEAELRRALASAARQLDDGLFVDVLAELVYVIGYEAARYDQALALGDVLLPYLDRQSIDGESRGTALSHLGVVRWARGDLDGAEALFKRSLGELERTLGRDHPRLAPVLDNLGNVASDAGRTSDARVYYERSLALVRGAFGEEHPDVGRALLNLGTTSVDAGDLGAAIVSYTRALQIFETQYGPSHMLVAAACNDLGDALLRAGRAAESLAACRRALAVGAAVLPADHPLQAHHNLCMARAELALGRPDDARPYAAQALTLRAHDPDDVERAEATALYGKTLWTSDRARARKLIGEARALYAASKRGATEVAALDEWIGTHR